MNSFLNGQVYLSEARYVAHCRAVSAHPDDLRGRVSPGRALHRGSCSVAEVHPVLRLLDEDGAHRVILTVACNTTKTPQEIRKENAIFQQNLQVKRSDNTSKS